MRLPRLLLLALLSLGCGGASDLPDSKPEQMFDSGGSSADARPDAGPTPDAPVVDAPIDTLLPDVL